MRPQHTICLQCQGVLLPSRYTLCRSPGFLSCFHFGTLPHTPVTWHPWTRSSICSAWGFCCISREFLSLHHSLESSSKPQIWAVTGCTPFISCLRVTVFHDLRSSS